MTFEPSTPVAAFAVRFYVSSPFSIQDGVQTAKSTESDGPANRILPIHSLFLHHRTREHTNII